VGIHHGQEEHHKEDIQPAGILVEDTLAGEGNPAEVDTPVEGTLDTLVEVGTQMGGTHVGVGNRRVQIGDTRDVPQQVLLLH